MPYKLSSDGLAVMKAVKGGAATMVKRYPTHAAALAALRALYANVPDSKTRKRK